MFIKKKSNILFRDYKSFGYITDNRNFEYKQITDVENYVGDKILSASGSLFMSFLTKKPQSFDVLIEKIMKHYKDVDIDIIKSDAIDFYFSLEQDGFVISGETENECDNKDTKFSYKQLDCTTAQNKSISSNFHPDKSTQDFLEEFFNGKPQLTNLHIELTSLCNERCVHCYIPHEYKTSYLDPELFYSILDQCNNMRLLHLTLSGGEPMLHKNFVDFLKQCKEYEFSVV